MDAHFLKGIVTQIATLPPLPQTAQRLLDLTASENTSAEEIVKVISADQTIAAKLLQIIHSPFYGLQQEVNSISEAVFVMGLDAIRSLALSIAVIKSAIAQNEFAQSVRKGFWQHSISVACTARHLAAFFPEVNREQAFVAGLVHDVGKLVFLEYAPELYQKTLKEAKNGKMPLCALEYEIFETDHASLGGELCRHWRIPEIISTVIETHHTLLSDKPGTAHTELDMIVSLANEMAEIMNFGDSGNALVSLDFTRLLNDREIAWEDLEDKVKAIVREAYATCASFGFSDAAPALDPTESNLVFLCLNDPGEWLLWSFIAWSHGYEVIGDLKVKDDLPWIKCAVYDDTIEDDELRMLNSHRVKSHDFSAWKKEHMPAESRYYPVKQLHQLFMSK